MNEKIKEISNQCWSNHIYKMGDFDQEKFAQLIIEECIRQIVRIPTRVEYLGGQSFTYIQLGETVETIKNHFGV